MSEDRNQQRPVDRIDLLLQKKRKKTGRQLSARRMPKKLNPNQILDALDRNDESYFTQ